VSRFRGDCRRDVMPSETTPDTGAAECRQRVERARTLAGATGIATLRCLDAGHRWDEIWKRPRSQTAPADLVSLAS
jgi:hypothetical protein